MATILYKFRSGTTFEALPMPGTSARLFDVKRAIVKAKRLDRAGSSGPQLEFDLSVKNAQTDEEYTDEGMLLPRGTRVVVQRLPAARGHGLLARIARAESGMAGPSGAPQSFGNATAAQSGFYTISSRGGDEEDEFVDTKPQEADDEKEMAALRAVTEQAGTMGGAAHANKVWTAGTGTTGPTSVGGAPHPTSHRPHHTFHKPQHHRPNADPELREAERREMAQPKKRATGIPRTFLNLSAPPPAVADTGTDAVEGSAEVGGLTATLQPNAIGFEALVARGGGQSGTGPGSKKRDLDYALKLTATSIPEHLQCGVCDGVVKNAMLIPWDPEGRTACEVCIRDGLTKNAFRCPLTGQDGVSPDDLLPNKGLRKAAELFIAGVMEKMDAIEQAREAEEEEERQRAEADSAALSKPNSEGFEGGGADKGIVITRKNARQPVKQRGQSDDLFGGDDEFGGDVFDVGGQDEDDLMGGENEIDKTNDQHALEHGKAGKLDANDIKATDAAGRSINAGGGKPEKRADKGDSKNKSDNESKMKNADQSSLSPVGKGNNQSDTSSPKKISPSSGPTKSPGGATANGTSRAEMMKKRGPPAGYAMGPAGGATVRSSGSPMPGPLGGGNGPKGASAPVPGRAGGRGGFLSHPNGGRGVWGGRGGPPASGLAGHPHGGGAGGPGGHGFGGPPVGGPPPRGGWGGGTPPPGGPPGPYPGRGFPGRGGFGGRGGRGWESELHSRAGGGGAVHYGGEGQDSHYSRQRGTSPSRSDERGSKRSRGEGEKNSSSKDESHRRDAQRHRIDERGGPGGRGAGAAPWGNGRDPWGHGVAGGRGGDWGYDPRLMQGGGPRAPPPGAGGRHAPPGHGGRGYGGGGYGPPPGAAGRGYGYGPPGSGGRGYGGGGFGRGRY